MKSMLSSRILLFVVLVTQSVLPASAADGSPAPGGTGLASLRDRYVAALFQAKPHLGSYMGDHSCDGKLPDLSPEALARRRDELAAQAKELAAIRKGELSRDDRIDAEIIADAIGLELLYLDEIKESEWDPRLRDSFPYYDPRELVAERVSGLVYDQALPPERRVAALTSLLEAVPKLLAQVRHSLKNPPRIFTEFALKDNTGRIELFKTEVAKAVAAIADAAARARAKTALDGAVAGLESYQQFLEKDLLPRSKGSWQLGAVRYRKKFPLALCTDLTTEAAVSKAQALFDEARRELFQVAVKLHQEMFPGQKAAGAGATPAEQAAIINRVKEAIGEDHPKPENLVESHAAGIERMRAFITEHDLIKLPPAETLKVRSTPAFKRGVMAAEYLSPNLIDPQAPFVGTYYVDPVDPTWPKERVESYLKANCTASNELTGIHEAYPGHHVQAWYSKQKLNPLRTALWNAPMVEGWAVYGQNLMVGLGWGGKLVDRYRFLTLRGHLIVAGNLILDVKLHTGQMSDEQALRFLIDECFYEKAAGEKKLVRAKLDSTQLSQYFLGYAEILELERDQRKKVGAAFSQRAFNEELVGHGSIAVKYLRRYLMGGD